MAHRVADELISRLVEVGVERIYGVVGDSLNPVMDALRPAIRDRESGWGNVGMTIRK